MTAPAVHDPMSTLLAALARRRDAGTVHPWPLLVANTRMWCIRCKVHVASETGSRPRLCIVCEGE